MSSAAPRTMRRSRLIGPEKLVIEEVAIAPLGPREVRIRVQSCGICGSDVAIFRGTHPVISPPVTLGHEVIGDVVELGSDVTETETEIGAVVVLIPQVGCGACGACARGTARLCESMLLIGGQLDGGLAEFLAVPVENVRRVPSDVPASLRSLIEPLSVATHAVRRGAPQTGERCLVLGAGPIGTLVALAAQESGADVVVAERRDDRRDFAQLLGLDAREESGDEYDLVFECVGGAQLPGLALRHARAGGRVVLVGVAAPELTLDGIVLQRQERSIAGSHMYDAEDVDRAFVLLARGILPSDAQSLRSLVEVLPLTEAHRALASLAEQRTRALKIVVRP
ncbi:MAG: hypothetical protein K0R68_1461 [Mycobacterium sp.]|nr:hypothetical protein [Mycobacterium sp.]